MQTPAFLKRLLENGEKSPGAMLTKLDGWVNVLSGIGDATRDKSASMQITRTTPLQLEECLELFHSDDLANRIVTAVTEDAMREGFTVTYCDDSNDKDADDSTEVQDQEKQIQNKARELCVADKVREARIWARCTGGAAVYLMVDGAGLPEEPLDDTKIKKLVGLEVVDRGDIVPSTYYYLGPKIGQVETYRLTMSGEGGSVQTNILIHETRLVMFRGAMTSRRERIRNNGWDHSVLQRVIEVLKQVNGSWGSVMTMMHDFSQAVFKIKGLIDAMAEGGEKDIVKRMALVDLVRSLARAVVLDAEEEDYKVVERGAVTGIDTLIDKLFLRLSSAARMPVTILMGQAPAGLNATGASDLRWWYDTVRSEQEHEIKPRLERIIHIIARELFPGVDPQSWEVCFPSLWQMSATEEAAYRKSVADTDHIYITDGVVLAEEIALSRFGEGKYSAEYEVNLEARKQLLDMALEAKAAGLDPNADPNADPNEDPNAAPKQNAKQNVAAKGPANGQQPNDK